MTPQQVNQIMGALAQVFRPPIPHQRAPPPYAPNANNSHFNVNPHQNGSQNGLPVPSAPPAHAVGVAPSGVYGSMGQPNLTSSVAPLAPPMAAPQQAQQAQPQSTGAWGQGSSAWGPGTTGTSTTSTGTNANNGGSTDNDIKMTNANSATNNASSNSNSNSFSKFKFKL